MELTDFFYLVLRGNGRMMEKDAIDLKGCSLEELSALCQKNNIETFRAKQIAHWIYQKGISSVQEMNNLPVKVKRELERLAYISNLKLVTVQESNEDGTTKYLWGLEDGNTIETVLMLYEDKDQSKTRITVCLSSQVGCAMGCGFCATGLQGFVRNLTASEMIDQILQINNLLLKKNKLRVTNVVIMGMGEPLLNYDNTLKAIKIFHSFLDISYRRITLSTCGIVPKIKQLAQEKLPITLAVSLHAANNELRNQLMPINRKYPLEVLLPACIDYSKNTGRRVTFEYSLFQSINDSPDDAKQLSELLQGILGHINLIPVNPVLGTTYIRPRRERVTEFKRILEKAGIAVSIREEKGIDISAACGQLRQKEAKKDGCDIRG